MSTVSNIIADNLASVQERIAAAAEAAGRKPEEIQLVGVTKYVDSATAGALLGAGCIHLGESRPQQLWEKGVAPELAGASWHMIGHLQRNKVKRTAPLVDLIHSVDSLRLARALHDTATDLERSARILLEVNSSGDKEKHGLKAEDLLALLPQLAELEKLQVCGLMTMAAREGGQQVAAKNFASLRNLRDRAASECPPNVQLTHLSMGMSHDFEAAIREGATIVRIGSLLFDGVRR